MKNIITYITKLLTYITNFGQSAEISRNRDTEPSSNRDMKCPYCLSQNFVKRGLRQKKREKVQMYLCKECKKVFTQQITKGKHYPLPVMLDAVSIYNLGYSLEQTCAIINRREANAVLSASTLSNWLAETAELCRFGRLREYALKKYAPKDMVAAAALAHRQLYHYRFHRAKCALIIREDIKHSRFEPLREFLEMVPGETPHQYFQDGLRASEAPLTFSKTRMIVRAKQNYANKLCAFVLQSVKENKQRHQALQKFMLANDSVTVATEVPVYITKDDLEHLQTQLGFEIYNTKGSELKNREKFGTLPKLITGHIDILQIRNGQIHILDYKPNAEKERPIEQLTLYAMALSRLTGLRLFEFKCAWFDENDYFEFFPLHVLHKPARGRRRRKVYTMEGVYKINQDEKKISSLHPESKTNYVIH